MDIGILRKEAFPAHAGMNRLLSKVLFIITSVPRTRGDEPQEGGIGIRWQARSPHTRG